MSRPLFWQIRRDYLYLKTQKEIEKKKEQGVFPGAVFAFIEGDKQEIHVIGEARIVPEALPMDEDYLFDVASLTKVICTTSVVLKLLEDGKIQLDDPLKTYLPEFKDESISIRHLLTHTSDINTWIENRDELNQEELRAAYLTLKAGENLGKKVKYTDAGTILLGFMLEKIYWEDVIDIFQEEVLNPIGMMQSLFLPKASNRIVPTEQLSTGEVIHGVTHDSKARILAEHAGNAGLFTNVSDVIKFVEMYLQLGSVENGTFLKKETILKLLKDCTPSGKGHRSLGWDLKEDEMDGHPLLFHTGYTGTFLLLDVEEHSAFIFLSNRIHPADHRDEYIQNRDEILSIYLKEKALKKK